MSEFYRDDICTNMNDPFTGRDIDDIQDIFKFILPDDNYVYCVDKQELFDFWTSIDSVFRVPLGIVSTNTGRRRVGYQYLTPDSDILLVPDDVLEILSRDSNVAVLEYNAFRYDQRIYRLI
jgi:hypothetical protein